MDDRAVDGRGRPSPRARWRWCRRRWSAGRATERGGSHGGRRGGRQRSGPATAGASPDGRPPPGPAAGGASQHGGRADRIAVWPPAATRAPARPGARPATPPTAPDTEPVARHRGPRRPHRRRPAPRRVARADLPPSRAAHPARRLARLGVLVVGPEGVGRRRSCAAPRPRSGPLGRARGARGRCARTGRGVGPGARRDRRPAARRARDAPVVLLVTDVDALLPAAAPPPLATLVLDALRAAVATPHLALVATTSAPESVDPRLRAPDLADRELGLPLPDLRARTELLRRLLTDVPTAEGSTSRRSPSAPRVRRRGPRRRPP